MRDKESGRIHLPRQVQLDAAVHVPGRKRIADISQHLLLQ
jgi:hypothetical protein